MILFLYGPDTYRSGKKLKEIVARYTQIHTSGMSFHMLHTDEDDFNVFRNAAGSVSMFGEKKLVALGGLSSACPAVRGPDGPSGPRRERSRGAKEFIEMFMAWPGKGALAASKDVVCVFHDERADKKSPFFAWLLKNAKVQEFATLGGAQLQRWAQQFVQQRGIQIEKGALARLLVHTGGDLWAFENEIQKLKFYAAGVIDGKDLDVFLTPCAPTNIFAFVDAVVVGDKAKAAQLLRGHLEGGDNESYLFFMIQSQFRNVAQAQWFLEKGESDAYRIGRLCGMHPYVAKKSLAQAKAFDKARIKKIYSQLVDLDSGIKQGIREPHAALEELILFA